MKEHTNCSSVIVYIDRDQIKKTFDCHVEILIIIELLNIKSFDIIKEIILNSIYCLIN